MYVRCTVFDFTASTPPGQHAAAAGAALGENGDNSLPSASATPAASPVGRRSDKRGVGDRAAAWTWRPLAMTPLALGGGGPCWSPRAPAEGRHTVNLEPNLLITTYGLDYYHCFFYYY